MPSICVLKHCHCHKSMKCVRRQVSNISTAKEILILATNRKSKRMGASVAEPASQLSKCQMKHCNDDYDVSCHYFTDGIDFHECPSSMHGILKSTQNR